MIWSVILVYEAPTYADAQGRAVALGDAVRHLGAHVDGVPAERAPLVQLDDNDNDEEVVGDE